MSHFFISYAHTDNKRVKVLVEEIEARNFATWMDKDLPTGSQWRDEIAHALKESRGVIVMMSPNSATSVHVKDEVGLADTLKKPIFPVLIGPIEATDFWELQARQYEQVCDDDSHLSEKFFADLAQAFHAKVVAATDSRAEKKAIEDVKSRVQKREQVREEIGEYLKDLAHENDLPITYAELALKFGLDLNNVEERTQLFSMLGDVSKKEFQAGRPLLGAMVVSSNPASPYPGKGFYNLARTLKPDQYANKDDATIYESELEAIRDHWHH